MFQLVIVKEATTDAEKAVERIRDAECQALQLSALTKSEREGFYKLFPCLRTIPVALFFSTSNGNSGPPVKGATTFRYTRSDKYLSLGTVARKNRDTIARTLWIVGSPLFETIHLDPEFDKEGEFGFVPSI